MVEGACGDGQIEGMGAGRERQRHKWTEGERQAKVLTDRPTDW